MPLILNGSVNEAIRSLGVNLNQKFGAEGVKYGTLTEVLSDTVLGGEGTFTNLEVPDQLVSVMQQAPIRGIGTLCALAAHTKLDTSSFCFGGLSNGKLSTTVEGGISSLFTLCSQGVYKLAPQLLSGKAAQWGTAHFSRVSGWMSEYNDDRSLAGGLLYLRQRAGIAAGGAGLPSLGGQTAPGGFNDITGDIAQMFSGMKQDVGSNLASIIKSANATLHPPDSPWWKKVLKVVGVAASIGGLFTGPIGAIGLGLAGRALPMALSLAGAAGQEEGLARLADGLLTNHYDDFNGLTGLMNSYNVNQGKFDPAKLASQGLSLLGRK